MNLHLGCGKRQLSGYVHVDLSEHDHIDYVHDVKTLPMFDANSVDLIYSSHTLEYFDRNEVNDVLQEWYRVLQPGGLLRLAVPDFAALCTVYRKSNDLNKVIGPMYGRWEMPEAVAFHKTIYDFISLKTVLETNGFSNIELWDWEKVFVGEHAGFDDYSQAYYPHMDKENGILLSLNIEGTK